MSAQAGADQPHQLARRAGAGQLVAQMPRQREEVLDGGQLQFGAGIGQQVHFQPGRHSCGTVRREDVDTVRPGAQGAQPREIRGCAVGLGAADDDHYAAVPLDALRGTVQVGRGRTTGPGTVHGHHVHRVTPAGGMRPYGAAGADTLEPTGQAPSARAATSRGRP